MKRAFFVLALVCLCLLPAICLAQSTEPKDFVAAGLSWNQYATPQLAGSALYAHQVSGGTYSFSVVDVVRKTANPFTVTTSVSTGVAQHVKDVGPAHIYATTTVGVSAGGENVGWSWSGGGAVVYPIRGGWSAIAGARVLKSSIAGLQVAPSIGIAFGR